MVRISGIQKHIFSIIEFFDINPNLRLSQYLEIRRIHLLFSDAQGTEEAGERKEGCDDHQEGDDEGCHGVRDPMVVSVHTGVLSPLSLLILILIKVINVNIL